MPIDNDTGLPRHTGEWTLEAFFALPVDQGRRVELVDGALLVSPAPTNDHQDVVLAVADALRVSMPAEWKVLIGPNVIVGPERALIPDLVVVARDAVSGRKACDAADLLLTVEVVSPSSRLMDYATKRVMYAEARIPHYLVVDPTKPGIVIESHELRDGSYELVLRSEDGSLKLDRPYPVGLDLAGI